jgi:hypothetical protein
VGKRGEVDTYSHILPGMMAPAVDAMENVLGERSRGAWVRKSAFRTDCRASSRRLYAKFLPDSSRIHRGVLTSTAASEPNKKNWPDYEEVGIKLAE